MICMASMVFLGWHTRGKWTDGAFDLLAAQRCYKLQFSVLGVIAISDQFGRREACHPFSVTPPPSTFPEVVVQHPRLKVLWILHLIMKKLVQVQR